MFRRYLTLLLLFSVIFCFDSFCLANDRNKIYIYNDEGTSQNCVHDISDQYLKNIIPILDSDNDKRNIFIKKIIAYLSIF